MKPEYKRIITDTIVSSLKAEFKKADWWSEVQDDVRTRLEWVIDHIEQVGSFFYRTFMTLFRWEFERRRVEGQNIINPMGGYLTAILGVRISEEAFQCGSLPARAVLNLYDYTAPNDADVTACMFLCHKIETLQRAGLLVKPEEKLATSQEIGSAFQQIRQARKKSGGPLKPPPSAEESIQWDFDEDGENQS